MSVKPINNLSTQKTQIQLNEKEKILKELDITSADFPNFKLSRKSIKLMATLDEYIGELYAIAKKENRRNEDIKMPMIENKHGGVLTIKPVYTQQEPSILFSYHTNKGCENILFERKNPNNFRYEKTVYTDFGSATLKTFYSKLSSNHDIEGFVDKLIMEHVPKIFSTKQLSKYFTAAEMVYRHGKVVLI